MRKEKLFKAQEEIEKLILVVDVYLDNSMMLKERAVVGRCDYMKIVGAQMKEWIDKKWTSIVGYCLKVSILVNGWFGVHFMPSEDAEKISSRPWVRGREFLRLKKWYIGFDPSKRIQRENISGSNYEGFHLSFGPKGKFRR